MDKKVRIITRRAGYNFGSSLQAYAMQQIVYKLGFENKIIDYDELSKNIKWRVRPFFDDCLFFTMNLAPTISNLVAKKKYKWLVDRNTQKEKFQSFEKENLVLTRRKYKSSKAIVKDAKDYDICICGSDQIWSPLLYDPVMFLSFCTNSKTKTIAYAPSFGINRVETYQNNIKEFIQRIQFLSVREEQGHAIIKDLTGRAASVVLDPTLLLKQNDWEKVMVPVKPSEPYILCYFLGNKYIPHNFITDLQTRTQCKIINICTFRTINTINGECLSTASPAEFISYIANANYVCTDSFHGTIFSILFERQFFTFERFQNEQENQNSRIHTLLQKLEASHRLIPYNAISAENVLPIDFATLKSHLETNRAFSIQYLKTALECNNRE